MAPPCVVVNDSPIPHPSASLPRPPRSRWTLWNPVRLAMVSAIARAPAFLVPLVIAAAFGAGALTDAYFLAYTGALLIGGTIGQGLESAVVPFAARAMMTPGAAPLRFLDRAAARAAWGGLGLWVCVVGGLTLLEGPAPSSIVLFGVLFTPFVVAWCASAVFSGALVSQHRIGAANGSNVLRGMGALLGAGLAPVGGGLSAVVVGLAVGEGIRFWWLRGSLRNGLTSGGSTAVDELSRLTRSSLAQAGANVATGAVPLIERLLAATLGLGALSHLEYGFRLLVLPAILFEGALAPLLLARWAGLVATQGIGPSRQEVGRSVLRGVLAAAACTAVLLVGAPLLVRAILQHGRFDEADAATVVHLLRLLSIGFVATMGALLLERAFLARSRNSVLAKLSWARATLRLLGVVALLEYQGLAAFAIAYAVADWAYMLALWLLLPRDVGVAEWVPSGSTKGSGVAKGP